MIQYFPIVTGSLTVNGDLIVTGTGSVSASLANNSLLLQGTGSVGFATTSSLLVVSSSQQQISASLLNVIANYATTGSNSFRANQSITGSLVVSSTITAQTLVVQTVTSSIVYSSGSNLFGSTLGDRQTFTGSVIMTGSLVVNTTGPELQVNNNGVVMGNLLSDNHSITGSLRVTGSTTLNGVLTGTIANFVGAITSDITDGGIILTKTAGNSTGLFANTFQISGSGTKNDLNAYTYGGESFGIWTNAIKRLTVTGGGNVGIGVISPVSRLQVQDSANTFPAHFSGQDQTNGVAIGTNSSNVAVIQGYTRTFSAVNNIALQADGGSVGIGGTGPYAKLSIIQDITTTAEFGSFGQFTIQGATNVNKLLSFGFNTSADVGFIQAMVNGVSYNNLLLNPRGGSVGIGTSSPGAYALNIANSASSGIFLNGTGTGGSWMAYATSNTVYGYTSTAYHLFTGGSASDFGIRAQENLVFGVQNTERMRITSGGNVGIGITSPAAKFHNKGSFVTESGNQYGEAKSFVFQSSFNNPTINLLTINTGTVYGATIIRVTVYQNTVSTGMCNIHVGYAYWAGNPLPTILKGVSGPSIEASFNGGNNVGTLAWSGNTLQYTSNRMTNFDGYSIVVEWGANIDNNATPTYGGNLQ